MNPLPQSLRRHVDPVVWLAKPLPKSYLNYVGRNLFVLGHTLRGLLAFGMITLGVMITKTNSSSRVIRPLIRQQIARAGLRLLPIITFVAVALGLVVIGQTVSLLSRVGAQSYAGPIMVSVVIRELGPLVAALLVLARVGTAIVIELATARALGEVEALEALAIDPVHYLVVPRVIGVALAIFSLTVYFILAALVSGYLFAFVQDVPLMPGDYVRQIAQALGWEDFVLLALKALAFGTLIALSTCFHGLAQPMRLEEVAQAATAAVVVSVIGCVLLEPLFILVYLSM